MKAFFNLSQRGQIIRLRKLANAALQRYDIGETSLRFLSNTDNTVFRVDQDIEQSQRIENTTASRRFILRIARSEKDLREETIKAELLWLSVLRTQANLVVPEPVPLTVHLFKKYLLPAYRNPDTVSYFIGSMVAFGIMIC